MNLIKLRKELIEQKKSKFKGNIYYYSQVNFSYNYFFKNGLTSKPIKYFKENDYEIMITEFIDLPTAGIYFNSYQEISFF